MQMKNIMEYEMSCRLKAYKALYEKKINKKN